MEAELNTFLNEFAVERGSNFSHTTSISPKRSYFIPKGTKRDGFLTFYCNAVLKNSVVGITERSPKSGASPLRVDFDFRFSLDNYTPRTVPIGMEHIKEIIRYYQIAIKDITEGFLEPFVTTCLLLQKKTRWRVEDGVIKGGFHLHFPFFYSKSWVQDNLIRSKVMKAIVDTDLFKGMKMENSLEGIVDKIATKTWLMYGSRKSIDAEAWEVDKCFDLEMREIDSEDVFDDEMRGKKNSVKYYLPRFLSILGYEYTETSLKERYQKVSKMAISHRKKHIPKLRNEVDIMKDIKLIQDAELMRMLKPERAEDRSMWLDVGWTLFCIGEGCDEAFELWLEFSKGCSEKFSEDVCIKEWDGMENKGKTLASLMWMARSDSPEDFKLWRESSTKTLFDDILNSPAITNFHMARLMHHLYENKIVCASAKSNVWYEFRGHRWVEMDDALGIKRKFPLEMMEMFHEKIYEMRSAAFSGGACDELCARQKKALKAYAQLGDTTFINKCTEASKYLFYNGKFLSRLDENRTLLGFENGVYDLELSFFRAGRPDDYITFSCGINYRRCHRQDEDVLAVEDFLKKIFPNPHLRDYFLDFMCSCLKGGNENKRFVIFTGDGDNGKSVTVALVEMILGDYCWTFPRELIIRGRGNASGAARPEMVQVKGKRIAFFSEIAKNEEINIGTLKHLTGNDKFYARTLYKEGGAIKPMFTAVLQCNDPPKIPAHDEPTWNRIRVLDFEANFVDNPPRDRQEQFKTKTFPIDRKFGEKLEGLKDAFMWILLERFKLYKKRGLKEPKEVYLSTQNYKTSNDVYLQFIDECLVKTERETDLVTLPVAYSEFKEWYQENHPSYRKDQVGRNVFRDEVNRRIGGRIQKIKSSWGWKGWKLNIEESDPIENFQIHLDK